MVVSVDVEKIVKHVHYQYFMSSTWQVKSIKGEQPAMLLGGHHGQTSKFLVGHMAEMHGKWPMAACYFTL